MIAPSWIFTRVPTVIDATSPLTTAPNQTVLSAPSFTSPTIVQLGASQTESSIEGDFPLAGRMRGCGLFIMQI